MATTLTTTKTAVFELKMPQTFRLQEAIVAAYAKAARIDNPHMDHRFHLVDVTA